MPDLPAHITITDRMIRHIDANCRFCDSQAHIGQYDDPTQTNTLLDQWIDRHRHEGQPPTARAKQRARAIAAQQTRDEAPDA